MNLVTKLSLMTRYYIHKLLRQQAHQLKSIVAQGAGLGIDAKADLDRVLESLYLEEDEIAVKVQQLENLTRCHQVLIAQNNSATEELIEVERQIFWILGLKKTSKP